MFDEDWTEQDMADHLGWQAEQALRCSGCGGFVDETMDPANAEAYDAEMVVCHRCAAGDRTERAFMQQKNPDTAGLKRRIYESD